MTGKKYRQEYTEEDIAELIKDDQFLAAMDSYAKGIITGVETTGRGVKGPPYLPRGLGVDAYSRMINEIARRIIGGLIAVPANLRDRFPQVYAPTEMKDL